MSATEHDIREAHAAWLDAVNSGDVARVLALMAEDAVLMGAGQPPLGRNEFPANYSAAHARAHIVCISDLEDVSVAGDVAYAHSRDVLRMTPHDRSATLHLAGYRLTVYRRQADGRWLLVRDAHTLSVLRAWTSR